MRASKRLGPQPDAPAVGTAELRRLVRGRPDAPAVGTNRAARARKDNRRAGLRLLLSPPLFLWNAAGLLDYQVRRHRELAPQHQWVCALEIARGAAAFGNNKQLGIIHSARFDISLAHSKHRRVYTASSVRRVILGSVSHHLVIGR